jgi:hypothetical protein
MNRTYIILISLIAIVLLNTSKSATAQQNTTKLKQEVEVVKAYRPSVSDAFKINQMPEIDDTARFVPQFNYSIKSRPYTSLGKTDPITAAELKTGGENNLGYGYLKLGFGSYTTPYGEFFFNKPRSEKSSFGMHFRHLSSSGQVILREGEKTDAPYSDSDILIFGKHFGRRSTFSYDFSYTRNAVNFYGYVDTLPSMPEDIPSGYYGEDQIYQKGALNLQLKSSEKLNSLLKYNSKFHYHSFSAKTGQKETNAGIFGDFDYEVNNNFSGILETSIDYYNTDLDFEETPSNPSQFSSTWVKINPSILLEGDNWLLQGGFNFYTTFNSDGDGEPKIYPKLKLSWSPVEGIVTLYAGADGYLQNNHYSGIAYENNWVNPTHKIRNSDHKYIISGGLKGKFNTQTSYNFGAKYSRVNDMYFYSSLEEFTSENGTIYHNDFNVFYDNTDILNFTGEISYLSETDFYLLAKGNYYSYTPDSIEILSHLPLYDLTFTSGYRINERLTGFADLKVIGEREALVEIVYDPNIIFITAPPQSRTVTLEQIIRINLGATYELSNSLKLFGRVDNLLNQNYEEWLGYNVQGIRFMAGASLSF